MDERIKKILHDCFNKYDVPDEAIAGATQQLAQLLLNPAKNRTGATVMTEAASAAGDNVTFEDQRAHPADPVKRVAKPSNPAKPTVM